ncbi:MAG: hypothetical protein ACKO7W_23920 [Elainella sp.]
MHRRFLGLGLVSLGLVGCHFSQVNAESTSPLVTQVSRSVGNVAATPAPTELGAQEVRPEALPEVQPETRPDQPVLNQSQTAPSVNGSVTADAPDTAAPKIPSLAPASPDSTASTAASLQQDYGPTTPLPATGQVTIRSDIRSLDLNQLIAPCPSDSSPYAFAESTNYRVQICSAEYDPWQPKYYIGQSKQGNEELQITSTDPAAARQLIFNHAGYTYVLYRDGRARTADGSANAYLQVFTPSGEGYAEALLYFYETSPLNLPQ